MLFAEADLDQQAFFHLSKGAKGVWADIKPKTTEEND